MQEILFNKIKVHGFFMEYDSERAGGFEPLRMLPKDKPAVLGLVTTKSGRLESKDEIKRRIDEAAKFVSLEQLCLSPQCGFASTEEGNALAEDEQWAKLRMIVELADEVWGSNDSVIPGQRASSNKVLVPAFAGTSGTNRAGLDAGIVPAKPPSSPGRTRHRPRHRAAGGRKARASWSATSAPACKARARDAGPAQETVDAIKKAGGEAIASTLSITEPKNAEAIVKSALDAFGRVDILVNNAGILRDVIFHKMSWSDWSDVIAVHLNGSFNMSRAVAPLFREQNSGAFVHMTSTSGLVGNFGQANYMAAKLGIMGLSRGIALDMARFNVRSNCIAPFAFTRMIESIPAQSEQDKRRIEAFQRMTPEKIAPLAVYLVLGRGRRHHRADFLGPQQ